MPQAKAKHHSDAQASESVRITEIFHSIQGEARSVGMPTVFVRLTGCPLRCQYCDTAYAFQGGKRYAVDEVLESVATFGADHVTVTGGEPLAQPGCINLLDRLVAAGYEVSLETSGAMDIGHVDRRVSRVVDLKTPASGELRRNLMSNIPKLSSHDQLKFVICDRGDFDWACDQLAELTLPEGLEVLFSPSHEQLAPADLAAWILDAGVRVRMQLQIHKYIWGDVPGR